MRDVDKKIKIRKTKKIIKKIFLLGVRKIETLTSLILELSHDLSKFQRFKL